MLTRLKKSPVIFPRNINFPLGLTRARQNLTLNTMVKHVVKRDGRVVTFDKRKIVDAVLKAMDVTEEGEDIVLAAEIASAISKIETENMSV